MKYYEFLIHARAYLDCLDTLATRDSPIGQLVRKLSTVLDEYSADTLSGQRCSFCKKEVDEVDWLIEGEHAFICDECLPLAAEAVQGRQDQIIKLTGKLE